MQTRKSAMDLAFLNLWHGNPLLYPTKIQFLSCLQLKVPKNALTNFTSLSAHM
jgi:hypothetical protein